MKTKQGNSARRETPQLFFKQAAGHPPDAFTQIIVKHTAEAGPVGSAKTFLVDLPTGLSVNNQATPQCELEVEWRRRRSAAARGLSRKTPK